MKTYFKEEFVARVDENNNTIQYDLNNEHRSPFQLEPSTQRSNQSQNLVFNNRTNRQERLIINRNRGSSLLDKIYDSKDNQKDEPLSNLQVEIETYKSHVNAINLNSQENEQMGPLAFFKIYEKTFPLLSKIARAIFSVPATSVPSECLFSRAGLIQTDIRNKLSPKNLENLIFIKENKHSQFYVRFLVFIILSYTQNFS